MNIQFVNDQHKKQFQQMYRLLENVEEIDFSKTAYLFLITGDRDLQEKTRRLAHLGDRRFFHPEQLINEKLTGGSKILALLGRQFLKNEKAALSLHQQNYLSDEQLKLALNAIVVRRMGINDSFKSSAAKKCSYHFV